MSSDEYVGVGIQIGKEDGLLTVIKVFEYRPAYKAGVRTGDKIIKIDGEPTKNMDIEEVSKKLQGEKEDTSVIITVSREDKLIDFSIVRDVIRNTSYVDASDNVIYRNKNGFSVNKGSHVNLTKNYVVSNSYVGIFVNDEKTEALIRDNSIYYNKFGVGVGNGGQAEIINNDISYNSNDGLDFGWSNKKSQVIRNVLSYNGEDGIDLQPNSNVLIKGNLIHGNNNTGIIVKQSSLNEPISENFITNNLYTGILLQGESKATITNNFLMGNLNNICSSSEKDNKVIIVTTQPLHI